MLREYSSMVYASAEATSQLSHKCLFSFLFFFTSNVFVISINELIGFIHGWVLFIEEYFEIPMKKMNGKILLKTRSLKSRQLLLLSIGVQLCIIRTETLVWTNPIRIVLLMLLYWSSNRICVCVCLYLHKLLLMMSSPQVMHCPFLCPLDCRFVFVLFFFPISTQCSSLLHLL